MGKPWQEGPRRGDENDLTTGVLLIKEPLLEPTCQVQDNPWKKVFLQGQRSLASKRSNGSATLEIERWHATTSV